MHANSLLVFGKYAARYFRRRQRVLELAPNSRRRSSYIRYLDEHGCKIRDLWTANPRCKITDLWTRDLWTADPSASEGPKTVPMPDDQHLACADGFFDVVLSGNVLEHVWQPWVWFVELARVLRPGGLVVTVAPVTWRQHRVSCGPRGRLDCGRYWPDGMRALHEWAGLETLVAVVDSLSEENRGPAQMNTCGCLRPVDVVAVGRKPAAAP